MDKTTINGCNTGSYRRMAKKCRQCSNKEYCDNKRIEAEAYIIPQSTNIEKRMRIPQIGVNMEEMTNAIAKAMQSVGCGSSYGSWRT